MISLNVDDPDFHYTYPREFVCNYGETNHRIFAVVEQCDDHPFLETVLSCKDDRAADLATYVLNLAMTEGRSAFVEALADHVSAMLPHPPAASLNERLNQLYEYKWPRLEPISGRGYEQLPRIKGSADRNQPRDRRLSDFDGEVIRAVKLHEFHITDPDRVLIAAISQGWGPRDEEERDPDDPRDVLGAAWWLICGSYDKDLPGMECLYGQSGQSIYEPLRTSDGEEVAGWRADRIEVDFEAGRFRSQRN